MIIGPCSPEAAIALYALNMTGAIISTIDGEEIACEDGIFKTIEREHITDVIVPSFLLSVGFTKRLINKKESFGIKNIIALKTYPEGVLCSREDSMIVSMNDSKLKKVKGLEFMEDLIYKYETSEIIYGENTGDDLAIITHTSGTTSGTKKPITLTNKAINAGTYILLNSEEMKKYDGNFRTLLSIDAFSAYPLVDQLHASFMCGGSILISFRTTYSPEYFKAIEKYKIEIIMSSGYYLSNFKKIPDQIKPDFSSVKVLILGGTQVNRELRKNLKDIFNRFDSDPMIFNGYGLSETGGACLLSSSQHEDDEAGFPLEGIKIRIYDEDKKVFYKIEDGENVGGLYIHSPAMSDGKLFDEEIFKLKKIDNDEYVCTYDLAKVNKDGSISICGRMNNYFVNNDGIRFDAGLIENTIGKQENVESCILAPFYSKSIHDTVAALFIKVNDDVKNKEQVVKNILFKVFVKDGLFKESNLPSRVIILDKMPLGSTGKPNRHALNAKKKEGMRFFIRPIKKDDKLLDIILQPVIHDDFEDSSPDEIVTPFETLAAKQNKFNPEDISANLIIQFKDISNPLSIVYTPNNGKNGSPFGVPNFGANPFMKKSNKMSNPFFGFMENDNYKGMPQPPYPFWMKNDGDNNPWNNFPKPPFMNQSNEEGNKENPWSNFVPPFGKREDRRPELSQEDYKKIIKGVQNILGVFFKKSNDDYNWED